MTAFVGLLIGVILAAGGTRASMSLARGLGILDLPGEIKIHREPTPRFGGFGIVLATLGGYAIVAQTISISGRWSIASLVGGLIIALTGAIDDIYGLRPLHKLLGQLAGGMMFVFLYWLGGKGTFLEGDFLLLPFSAVSVLFIAFMSNGINLLDGIDGLAAGTTAVITSFLTALAFVEGQQQLGLVLIILVGACLGFLFFNVPPAKTFMGDVGSLFLGYMIATAALQLIYLQSVSVAKVLGVVLILVVPIADTSLAILRRFKDHRNIFVGDRFHIYDCIYRKLGGNIWWTLSSMWGITLACGAAGTFAFFVDTTTAVCIALLVAMGMAVLANKVGSLYVAPRHSRHGLPM